MALNSTSLANQGTLYQPKTVTVFLSFSSDIYLLHLVSNQSIESVSLEISCDCGETLLNRPIRLPQFLSRLFKNLLMYRSIGKATQGVWFGFVQ